jgi:hypothetical protein
MPIEYCEAVKSYGVKVDIDELLSDLRDNEERAGKNGNLELQDNLQNAIMAIVAMQYELNKQWIPVTEKLPSSYEPVLVYGKEYDMLEDHWNTTFMILVYFWKHKEWSVKSRFKVLAWMPLPTPPKEVTE